MAQAEKFRYRPEIDGLRAIAVLAVVLFHAGLGCTGGFVGVDIFFVISGFLITSLIWKDLEAGTFTLTNFWERRFRRIVPALVVVTLGTLLLASFIMTPRDFRNLGTASLVQTVMGANYYYAKQADYFGPRAEEQPLLHTWSLAVEEQFYLIAPLAFWAVFGLYARRSRTAMIYFIAAGIALSFTLSLLLKPRYPDFVFYSLPTRAWELLLGCLLAFVPVAAAVREQRVVRETFAGVGLALLLAPIFFYHSGTPFPGAAAIPPCLGAALLIWLSGCGPATPTLVSRLLSLAPLTFIGLISYSLYLWHWPFLALNQYIQLTPSPLSVRLGLMALAVVCAILSWKFVETPFRVKQLAATPKSMFAYTAGGAAAVVAVGIFCIATRGLPQRLPAKAAEYAQARYDHAYQHDNHSLADVETQRLLPLGATDSETAPTILVWGDSHARCALPAFDAFLKEHGLRGVGAVRNTTPPVCNWLQTDLRYASMSQRYVEESVRYNQAVVDHVKIHKIPHVALVGRWPYYLAAPENADGSFSRALLETVRDLSAAGVGVWLMQTVPTYDFEVPRVAALAHQAWLDVDPTNIAAERRKEFSPAFLAKLEAAGCRILDPRPQFRSPHGEHYVIQQGDIVLYRDFNHLTNQGALTMLLPFLRDALPLDETAAPAAIIAQEPSERVIR